MPRHALVPLLLALLVVPVACGYELIRYPGNTRSADGPTVVIETLENDSYDPGYEFVMTDALRREFQRRGALRVVSDPEAADWVVKGAVGPVRTIPQSASSVVLTLEYELQVTLNIRVVDQAGESMRLGSRLLNATELYLASADVEAEHKNRQEALRRCAQILAVRVHEALYETGRATASPIAEPAPEPAPAGPVTPDALRPELGAPPAQPATP